MSVTDDPDQGDLGDPDALLRLERDLVLALGRASSLHEALRHCLTHSIAASGMDSGGIYLVLEDGGLGLAVHDGLSPGFVEAKSRYAPTNDHTHLVLRGKPIYVEYQNLGVDPGSTHASEGLQALAVVPVSSQDRVIACLNIASHRHRQISAAARQALETIAACAGMTITRLQAEEALRENEARYRAVVESMPDVVIVTDLEGRLLYANPALERITGYRPDEFRHPDVVHNIYHPGDVETVRAVMADFLRGDAGSSAPFQYRLQDKSGGHSWQSAIASRILYQGQPAVQVISRDVTESKRADQDRVHAEESLRQAQKMESIGRLAGGVAHDFNNLLTAIGGNISLALVDLHPRDPVHELLTDALKAVDSAADLTRQLLAFSRKQVIDPKVVNLNEVIVRLRKMLERLLGEDIELEVRLAEDLGQTRVDPSQIDQVLVNLAVNARDAMPDGGELALETQNVFVDAEYCRESRHLSPGEYVVLSVTDTGSGMKEEVKAHLFEPFYTTKEPGTGTGLGLATVYGAVRQNRGHIEVTSELGRGTTFRMYWPRVAEPPDQIAEHAMGSLSRGTETLLLVEDEETVRTLAARLLTRQGYRVHAFANGSDALRAAAAMAEPIHLLVTDVIMPGMNGRVLADHLRALRPELEVLFTSGYTQDVVVHHGTVEPGLEFLAKPYTPECLARRVRDLLDRPRARGGALTLPREA
jgi:two-component system, cell cycle sensor histidine kinase and response regulator CckA